MKKIKRATAFLLAAIMILSMAACSKQQDGGEQSQNTETERPEYVWVAEFVGLDTQGSLYNTVVHGDYMYYENYEWDEETQTSTRSIKSVSILDGSDGPEISLNDIGRSEKDDSNRNLSRFMLDSEGNLVTIETVYHWNEETGVSSQEFYACRYDNEGNKTSEHDFSDVMEDGYIQYADIDAEGRLYVAGDSVIHLFDAQMEYKGKININNDGWINSMGMGNDGKVYIAFSSRNSNGLVIQELDFEGRRVGVSHEGYVSSGGSDSGIVPGLEKDFLGNDGTSLYDYDMEEQTADKILDWLDCDINGSYVRSLKVLDDGRIMAAIYDWESNSSELALLQKKLSAEVPVKKNLTIASLMESSELQSIAVKFNKSNEQYHINIKSYFDYNDITYSGDTSNYPEVRGDAITRMNNDITSDDCPDMLVIGDNTINVAQFAAKGVFEDLSPYLDASSVVKRSDYFENILDAFTYDGVLISIPKTFSLQTVTGKKSDLGDRQGWTMGDILEYANAHPDAELFANGTKEYTLQYMLRYNLGNYVNWETGECNFNDESFTSLLELANRFPDSYEYNEDMPSYPIRIAAGEVLLETTYINDFESIQLADAIFGQDVTFIGYPNNNGDSGTYLSTGMGIAITSKCRDMDGAWSFIESWLADDSERYRYGLSTNKDTFNKDKEEATKIEYILDENGEPMLDENGEPMTYGKGGIGYGDDWEYEYHATTEEEVARLEALIASAKPSLNTDDQIINIINEEAAAFFKGQKSAADVAGVIQSRVKIYVDENR